MHISQEQHCQLKYVAFTKGADSQNQGMSALEEVLQANFGSVHDTD